MMVGGLSMYRLILLMLSLCLVGCQDSMPWDESDHDFVVAHNVMLEREVPFVIRMDRPVNCPFRSLQVHFIVSQGVDINSHYDSVILEDIGNVSFEAELISQSGKGLSTKTHGLANGTEGQRVVLRLPDTAADMQIQSIKITMNGVDELAIQSIILYGLNPL